MFLKIWYLVSVGLINKDLTFAEFEIIVNKFRQEIPGISISTDIIVGYPTETEEYFKETVKFVQKMKFEVINISKFASRPNTYARRLKPLTSEIFKNRSAEITKAYNELKNKKN